MIDHPSRANDDLCLVSMSLLTRLTMDAEEVSRFPQCNYDQGQSLPRDTVPTQAPTSRRSHWREEGKRWYLGRCCPGLWVDMGLSSLGTAR